MTEKMLVTQALDERELLVKKITDKIEKAKFYYKKVHDGYEIRDIVTEQIVRCYKIFEEQELE